jgi:hypothetical protein
MFSLIKKRYWASTDDIFTDPTFSFSFSKTRVENPSRFTIDPNLRFIFGFFIDGEQFAGECVLPLTIVRDLTIVAILVPVIHVAETDSDRCPNY